MLNILIWPYKSKDLEQRVAWKWTQKKMDKNCSVPISFDAYPDKALGLERSPWLELFERYRHVYHLLLLYFAKFESVCNHDHSPSHYHNRSPAAETVVMASKLHPYRGDAMICIHDMLPLPLYYFFPSRSQPNR